MNDSDLIIDEEIYEDPFFEIQTKQDVDDIIDKLDDQLWKIYEMNMFLDLRKKEMVTPGASITWQGKNRRKNRLRGSVSSAISLKERIIGNFNVRKRRQSSGMNVFKVKKRKRNFR